jgi:hypothetical protein
MEAIIYNNEEQAEALQTRLHNRLNAKKKSLRYNATRYSNLVYHPTDGRVAMPIDRNTFANVWAELETELTANEINNIEELTVDWYPEITLP